MLPMATSTNNLASGSLGALSTLGNQIVDVTGASVRLTGVNWDGFEAPIMAPTGLWARNYKDMLDQMKEVGFNSIRLPFSGDIINAGPNMQGINLGLNPDLNGLTPLQIMDKIVSYAGEIGMRITLDYHRRESGYGAEPAGRRSPSVTPAIQQSLQLICLTSRAATGAFGAQRRSARAQPFRPSTLIC
jgi:aryl-phospho-beta-D-glucosidase BglC (GH1 family)